MGMMGAGKSATTRALGLLTGWETLDNDEIVEAEMGMDAAHITATQGEAGLRRAELAALERACTHPGPVVAGVAGGVIGDRSARLMLSDPANHVVWLRASLETLRRRIGADGGGRRPWVYPDGTDALDMLYRGRAELYEQVADQVIDTDRVSPESAAWAILAALGISA